MNVQGLKNQLAIMRCELGHLVGRIDTRANELRVELLERVRETEEILKTLGELV